MRQQITFHIALFLIFLLIPTVVYANATYKTENIDDITFEIPADWDAEKGIEENKTYLSYNANDFSFLFIVFDLSEIIDEIDDYDMMYSLKENTKETFDDCYDDYNEIESKDLSKNGNYALMTTITTNTYGYEVSDCLYYLFENNHLMSIRVYSGHSYDSDRTKEIIDMMNHVIDSINITINEISNKETESYSLNEKVYSQKFLCHEENKIKIYFDGISYDNTNAIIKFYVENESSSNITVTINAYAINGIMSLENGRKYDFKVAKGKKANYELCADKNKLEEYSITEIAYIDILLTAYDNDTFEDLLNSGQLTLGTELFNHKTTRFYSEELYNIDGIRIDYLYSDSGTYWFAIENCTDNYIMYNIENLSINDFTVSDIPYALKNRWGLDNCQSCFTITPDEKFLTSNEINSINEIDFTVEVWPHASYSDRYDIDHISLKLAN